MVHEDDDSECYDDDCDYSDLDEDYDDFGSVIDCSTPGCLFMGLHFQSECFTAEMCERQEAIETLEEDPYHLASLVSMARHNIGYLATEAKYDVDPAVLRARVHVLAEIDLIFQAARAVLGLSLKYDAWGRKRQCNKLVGTLRCEEEPGHGGECFAIQF